ncbi:MAG: DUF1801 domain-containing protein [Myxococcales bacterium]|nr:DUF1801 domain-containing protein [Myxococcales bacterium]
MAGREAEQRQPRPAVHRGRHLRRSGPVAPRRQRRLDADPGPAGREPRHRRRHRLPRNGPARAAALEPVRRGRVRAAVRARVTARKKPKSPSRADTEPKPKPKPKSRSSKPRAGQAVVLLAGGNPQIAKADGDAPVQAYIAAMPGWKRGLGERLDALIVRNVPEVRKAVKWNSPLYGVEGQGWFLGLHTFTHYLKVTFFRGAALQPLPPGASKQKAVRYFDVRAGDELDEAQMATWVRQAAALPGWVP